MREIVMRVLIKKRYIKVPLMLCVAVCACVFLTPSEVEDFSDTAKAPKTSSRIEIVVAKKALPAMTSITLDDVTIHTVTMSDFPTKRGRFLSPTQVVGRVLASPVDEGRVLAESCFIPEGSGARFWAKVQDRSDSNSAAESDLDIEIADRIKMRFVEVGYTTSRERLRIRCEVSILDPNLTLGISERGTITQFENERGEIVDVTSQTRPTRALGLYQRPWYRRAPFVPLKPVRSAVVRLPQANNPQPQRVYELEPSQLMLELEPDLLGQESKKITHVQGCFYVLTAESLEYVEMPFEPNETWVRLTPDLEIRVLEAQSTESRFSYRIETRGEGAFKALLQPGCSLPNLLPTRPDFLDKDGKSVQDRMAFSHMPILPHIGGSGRGGCSRRVEKVRFAIAVNPSHRRISFELIDVPLPNRPRVSTD